MSKTQTEINTEIRAGARAFDMDSDEQALQAIDAMSGTDALPTSIIVEDANGDVPVAESLTLLTFRETPAWQSILNGVEILKQDLEKKSKNISLIRDERSAAADRLEGINIVMAFIGSQFQAAQERMANLSTEEKYLTGKEGLKQIAPKPFSESVSAQVSENTAAAVAFLSKKEGN